MKRLRVSMARKRCLRLLSGLSKSAIYADAVADRVPRTTPMATHCNLVPGERAAHRRHPPKKRGTDTGTEHSTHPSPSDVQRQTKLAEFCFGCAMVRAARYFFCNSLFASSHNSCATCLPATLTVLRQDIFHHGVTLDCCFVRNIHISLTPHFDRPRPSPHAPPTLFPTFFHANREGLRSRGTGRGGARQVRKPSSVCRRHHARSVLRKGSAGRGEGRTFHHQGGVAAGTGACVRACVCSRGGVRPYFLGVFFLNVVLIFQNWA